MDPVGMARLHERAGDFAYTVSKFILIDILDDVPIDTGALLRSLRLERVRLSVRRQSTRIWVGTDHWHFPEYGVVPHVIRTRGSGYRLRNLRKTWADGTKVNHPGQRAQAYMRRNFFRYRVIVHWDPPVPGRIAIGR